MQCNNEPKKYERECPSVKVLDFLHEGRGLLPPPPPPGDPSLPLKPPMSKKSIKGKLRLDPAPGPSDLFEGRLFGLDDLGCLGNRLTCNVCPLAGALFVLDSPLVMSMSWADGAWCEVDRNVKSEEGTAKVLIDGLVGDSDRVGAVGGAVKGRAGISAPCVLSACACAGACAGAGADAGACAGVLSVTSFL